MQFINVINVQRYYFRSDDAGGVNPGADNLAGESTEENTSCDRNNNSHGDGCNCRQNADCASDVCQNGKCKRKI